MTTGATILALVADVDTAIAYAKAEGFKEGKAEGFKEGAEWFKEKAVLMAVVDYDSRHTTAIAVAHIRNIPTTKPAEPETPFGCGCWYKNSDGKLWRHNHGFSVFLLSDAQVACQWCGKPRRV